MTNSFDFISPPWPAQEVAWFQLDPSARTASYQRQIQAGNSHLVREVRVEDSRFPKPHSPEAVWEIIGTAESEFTLLEQQGIRVPERQWHVFTDSHGFTRTLGRIGIIEGESAATVNAASGPADKAFWADIFRKLVNYQHLRNPGARLNDVYHLHQYILGRARSDISDASTSQLWLVDVEPIFNK